MNAFGGWIAGLLMAVLGIMSVASPAHAPVRLSAHVASQAGCAVDASVQAQPGVVFTDHGVVQGVREGGTYAFKGIPYAAAPVGPLRFRPPAEAACWSGLRDGSAFGNVCPQRDNGNIIGDEDCLSLNVWMPDAAQQNGPLPVMFFIHGGGNATGSSAQPIYDGGPLAERESAVVVTINYRLGVLGFLTHPALDAESDSGTSGNYGILDQIAALGWVQRNAGVFGGDTSRVMIFGESAGGVDVCMLVASPLTAGLFSRALIESGGCTAPALAAEERTASRYATAAGCDGAADVAACLRGLSASATVTTLAQAVSVVNPLTNLWHPNVDGYVLTGPPLDVIRAGNHNHVPIVIGANADETGAYVPAGVRTEADYRQAVSQITGGRAVDQILAEYPAAAFASPRQALVAVTTDAFFVCPSRTYARAAATGQQEPVYRYLFTHRLSGTGALLGAFHGLELAYVFGAQGAASGSGYVPTAADRTVSAAMMDYWSSFAATGVPTGPAPWPQYDPATDPYLRIDDPPVADAGVRTDRCDFWDRLLSGGQ